MNFIIIHDGKKESVSMADILKASVSQSENISTVVWTEKQYADNAPTLSSDEYLLFVGRTKVGLNITKSPLFKFYYHQYNMRYGWLGKQAILYTSSKYTFKKEDLEDFSNQYNTAFGIENVPEKETKKESVLDKLNQNVKNLGKKKEVARGTLGAVAAALMVAPVAAAAGVVGAVAAGSYLIKGKIDTDKLKKNSEQLLVKKFIDEGMPEFFKIGE